MGPVQSSQCVAEMCSYGAKRADQPTDVCINKKNNTFVTVQNNNNN